MKKVIIGLLLILYTCAYNTYYPVWLIEGTYVCAAKDTFGGDPEYGDTLILYDNMTFTSDTWGDGEYELKYSFGETRVLLNYEEYGSKAIVSTYFERTLFFGNPKIVINADLGNYWRKENIVAKLFELITSK